MLSRHGDDLLYQTNLILETVCNYWSKSHTKHSLTTFKFENGTLEVTIPQCRFSCFSETKLVFIENEILSQVTFFVEKNGKQQSFHIFYLNNDGIVNFGSPKRPPDVSWNHARNVEEHFMNELIQSASKACLL
ncbi:hypothetical protein ABF70_16520 [Enterobacter hormaechei subsp. steigerwaltii]|nr:hypothetical protein ABF70_16520 [Enterobacter hormaechei subsp. steigerwaltii]